MPRTTHPFAKKLTGPENGGVGRNPKIKHKNQEENCQTLDQLFSHGQTDTEQIYRARKQLLMPSKDLSNFFPQVVELVTLNSWLPCRLLGRKIKLEDRAGFSLHRKLAGFQSPEYPRALKTPHTSLFYHRLSVEKVKC